MKSCKFILNEISKGSACHEVKTHLADCPTCSAVFREAIQLQEFLLDVRDVEAPGNLKLAILNRVQQAEESKPLLPTLQMAFRAVVFAAVAVFGFWLGLQTANGNNNGISNDFEITQSQAYLLNTAPIDPDSLSEIYLKVVEEVKDEKR